MIHNDIKSDNVLIRAGRGRGRVEARIVDWELVQLGDPAWDLAGACRDMLGALGAVTPDARTGLAATRLMGGGGRRLRSAAGPAALRDSGPATGLGPPPAQEESALLTPRPSAFSAPRMIRSGYRDHRSTAMPTAAVILLQGFGSTSWTTPSSPRCNSTASMAEHSRTMSDASTPT